jgi:nucleoside-diphosphate-sugar epimerase
MLKILGNGLLARSFLGRTFVRSTLILASGVSNSNEQRETEYRREAELVEREIRADPNATAIYFSTCSIDSSVETRYTYHKLEMERLVSTVARRFFIIRLPQIVGYVDNSTLVSFLANSIVQGKLLNIQKRAERNLLDATDMVRIVERLVNNNVGAAAIQNIASGQSVAVVEIVREISAILDIRAAVTYTETGIRQYVDVSPLIDFLGQSDPIFLPDYWRLVLRKYVPSYAKAAKLSGE